MVVGGTSGNGEIQNGALYFLELETKVWSKMDLSLKLTMPWSIVVPILAWSSEDLEPAAEEEKTLVRLRLISNTQYLTFFRRRKKNKRKFLAYG